MSRTLLRLFAVALLALTIPVQGMASIVAGQCMVFGHHDHGGGHDPAAHSHAADAGAQDDEAGKASHCGSCTACCASASIAGPAPLSILPAAAHAVQVFSQFPPPSVQLDGVDRPPLAL
jgi:hypothetical protein